MKKLILPLILAAAFLFAGLNKAHAAAPRITIGSVTPPSTPATITPGSTGVVINGTSVTTNGNGPATMTGLSFTTNNNGNGQNFTNYFALANTQLWYTTSPTLTGGAEVAALGFGTTTATVTGGGQTLTFSGFSQAIAVSSVGYFYVVVNYNVANTTTFFELDELNLTSAGSTISNNGNSGFGGNYTLGPRAPSIAFGTVLPPSTPATINQGSTAVVISGTSATTNAYTTGSATITSLQYNTNINGGGQNFTNYFSLANTQLWYTTSATLTGGTEVAGAGIAGTTVTTNGSGRLLTFGGFSQTIAASTVGYFYVLVNYDQAATTTNFEIDLNAYTVTGGITTVTGFANGGNYTLAAVPVTAVAASLTTTAGSNGLSTPATISSAANYTVYGMSLTPSATGITKALTGLTFTTTTGNFNNYFYGTAYLYASNNSSFDGTAVQISTVTTGGNNTLAFTGFTIAQSITAGTTRYYYVVIVYAAPGVAATASQTLTLTGTTSTATVTISGSAAGPSYTYNPIPAVTAVAASLTTTAGSNGLSTSATISSAANYTVYGMSLTPSATGTTKALTGLTFTTSGAPSQFNNYFYGTAYLYASNNSSFDGTAVQISTVTTGGNNTLAFTGFTAAQSITAGTTRYYYVVIVYAFPGVVATASQTLTLTGTTSTATVTISGSAAGPSYTYNPIPYATATVASLTTTVNTSGLANSPIGTAGSYAVYGMSVTPSATGSTAALTGLTFTTTASPAQNNNYFYGTAYLYASTSSTFSTGTATQISTVTTGASTTLAFTGFTTAQTITPGTTMYYYVYIVYAAPGVAATATQYITYTSATSPAVISASASVAGPTYTYNPVPASPLTYYWWGNGATTDWRNTANWTTTMARTGFNGGSYPGANAADNAIFSQSYWRSGSGTQTPTIGAYSVLFNGLTVADANNNITVNLTVNSADSLTVSTLNVGASNQTANFSIAGTAAGVISSLRVTGTTNINYAANLIAYPNGIINFPSGSAFNFVGTNNSYGQLLVYGGTVNTSNCNFSFSPSAGVTAGTISETSGLMSYNGGTHTLSGYEPQILVSGGIANYNNATITVTGSTGGALMGIGVSGGTFNINGTSGSPSTINLGTLTTNGINSIVEITGSGYFNLGDYTTLNINTLNTGGSYNMYNSGVVTCAPTSTINPTSTTAYITNNAASTNFILLSDATGTATIGKLGNGAKITGTFSAQRFISTASRNYRLLTSPVNATGYTPGTAGTPNLINLTYLNKSVTVPTTPSVTYPGAFVGGPAGTGGGFTAATGGPCLYLYQESIIPSPTNFNTSFYNGKNIAVTKLSTYLTTVSTAVAAGGSGATASDNSTTVEVSAGQWLFAVLYWQ